MPDCSATLLSPLPRVQSLFQRARAASLTALFCLAFVLASVLASTAQAQSILEKFIADIPASEFIEGATAYGEIRDDVPVAPILNGSDLLGYAYITSDFVSTTGYSGKPIHVMVAIDPDAKILRAELVKHSEPIVLIGIPDSKIKALTESYKGIDIVAEAAAGGSAHDLEIISGATVTIMIIDDSIVRSGLKVSRALGLGGLANDDAESGPTHVLNMDERSINDWATMSGDGTIRRLTIDVGQINAAFEATGDPRVLKYAEKGDPEDTYIDMHTALVSAPSIGLSLMGPNEYGNLEDWLEEGEEAILIVGRGIYSFKGSGYVRGGIFDRIQLIQGDISVRFHDRQHRRLGSIAAPDAPSFTELDVFKIPADAGFDPTKPWRIQLLAQRAVGPVEKSFLTYDLGYIIPDQYLTPLAPPAPAVEISTPDDDQAARAELWQRIWKSKTLEIGILVGMLVVLTGVFFFQTQATRNARAFYWFRMGFLVVTLVFLGWSQNAQLSVVNLMALGQSLVTGFTWDAFLMDPLVFILWTSVAVTLLFWGRGGFCGWLCPFGALQELSNQIARFFKVPQWTLPWGLHERLWPIKYIIFLGLFGVSIVSIPLAEQLAEVEPFKTSIILKFVRSWPYVLFATVILGLGLFIERFYCRYLCPLGAALAIPGRLRMFDWLKRYKECGNPCQTCANECFVQAIHPTGEINPNECLSCLHCQVLYQDDQKCPVVIKKVKRRAKMAKGSAAVGETLGRFPDHPNTLASKGENHV
ncbi:MULTISPECIES: NosR/NirI family protein [Halocynthiibacter]|uniref:NosR/NirI family protein n=1 Tax=Halocynthiibacter halioticoli TaxID=2986804 RepID=A0AAE3IWS4_9RHOB|nr:MULTISPECIES: NosR/NirI family protein [Halocynthiibacter]MCV6823419.1 NosR/NirI family protein [Halocynthiibacter halioticoli]MCW4056420.1 NosR/NirI family protein [Halocynthiibacter sp. SDUM655004]